MYWLEGGVIVDDRRKPAFQLVRDQVDRIMLEVGKAKIEGDLRDNTGAANAAQIKNARWAARTFWVKVGCVVVAAAALIWTLVLP
jgi:hypothetical protein